MHEQKMMYITLKSELKPSSINDDKDLTLVVPDLH